MENLYDEDELIIAVACIQTWALYESCGPSRLEATVAHFGHEEPTTLN